MSNYNSSPKDQIGNSLEEVRARLATMRDALEDPADTTLRNVPDLLDALEKIVENIDAADHAADKAQDALGDLHSISNEDIEHVLLALKHLGLNDVTYFNMVDIKMALEATAGL